MIYGAWHVESVGGTLSIGTYVATINVFKEMGKELQEVYMEFMEVQRTYGPLKKLCFLINQETDLKTRMDLNRARRRAGSSKVEQARARVRTENDITGVVSQGAEKIVIDKVNIELNNITFKYPTMDQTLIKSVTV